MTEGMFRGVSGRERFESSTRTMISTFVFLLVLFGLVGIEAGLEAIPILFVDGTVLDSLLSNARSSTPSYSRKERRYFIACLSLVS